MSYTVNQESFDSLAAYWTNPTHPLRWDSIFVLPAWLKVWWQELGSGNEGSEPYLGAISQGDKIIGIAPLLLSDGSASFIGSADVCDYIDFVIAPDMEKDFFYALIDDLSQKGINNLDLRPLRPDSTVLTSLVDIARDRGYEVNCHQEDVSVETDLPSTWDEYLATLDKKQRHEVRRKLRRLGEAGNMDYRCLKVNREEVESLMDTFLQLFSLSWEEKASFMTPRMESYFRALAEAMAEVGLLRFGIVELDSTPAAMTMGFDYNNTMYLYNSAYNPQYNSLSVGLVSKALCIRESIQDGRKRFDFLKGDETYKSQLGGKEIPIYNCQINIR